MSYDKQFTDALQFIWGKGFLSPGGPEDVRELLRGRRLTGLKVLDIGSGLGGVDILLAAEHGAEQVTGTDVDPWLIARARELVTEHGLSHRISFVEVSPGPLPFADASFDVVFSKDAMIHIPDKSALYADVLRVLKPGGRFIASDWLFGEGAAESETIIAWNGNNPLGFAYATPPEAQAALVEAGFADTYVVDRSDFLAAVIEEEIVRLEGPAQSDLARIVGTELAAERALAARQRLACIVSGDFKPSHLGGTKPASAERNPASAGAAALLG